MSATVTLHTKTGCPWCERAKAWLRERGIPYTAIRWDDDAGRAALYDRLGLRGPARTVPQVVVEADGEAFRVGGYTDLILSGVESLFGSQGDGG